MSGTYHDILNEIPHYLRQYIVDQHYERYTARDHAVWRYIMRRNFAFLKKHAHSSYLEGLEKTGISIDHIPHIDEMNKCLTKIGWKAVIVDGFLPPAVFMEFQFLKILVISAEIRSMQHILYTPAPDIVHEAAGHAPIIANKKYADFLQRFGEYGMKAFSSKIDIEIYEAIRHLSIIKEYPDTTEDEIKKAEEDLNNKIASNTVPSEMTLLSRLHWWTVEYGLIGTPEEFKIYGAGLLSSVGESKNCLESHVKKIPLSVKSAGYNYDITKEQPQLFVNKTWDHLISVLEEFADSLSFRKGGMEAFEMAINSQAVATAEYSSGLQVSGQFVKVLKSKDNSPFYIQTKGPTSLAYKNKQLKGHGIEYHSDGFGSPVGALLNISKPLQDCSEAELKFNNVVIGKDVSLKFASGITVQGKLISQLYKDEHLILLSFENCAVTAADGQKLFEPNWGIYDMAVGDSISSVFSGTADKENHNVYPDKSKKVAIPVKYSESDKKMHRLYAEIRKMREEKNVQLNRLDEIFEEVKLTHPKEWLIHLEILELLKSSKEEISNLEFHLEKLKGISEEYKELIESGQALLN